jgi:hypothetical protein
MGRGWRTQAHAHKSKANATHDPLARRADAHGWTHTYTAHAHARAGKAMTEAAGSATHAGYTTARRGRTRMHVVSAVLVVPHGRSVQSDHTCRPISCIPSSPPCTCMLPQGYPSPPPRASISPPHRWCSTAAAMCRGREKEHERYGKCSVKHEGVACAEHHAVAARRIVITRIE